MLSIRARLLAGIALAATAATSVPAFAEGELNLYSSRHYDTDERLYSDFEELTGITINRIEGNADELIARMEAEGANSPADVFLTVDTVRLARAKPTSACSSRSKATCSSARVPSYLQDDDNRWFAFSQRARILFYDKTEHREPAADLPGSRQAGIRGRGLHPVATNVYTQNISRR
jgi:iron(III) transport system substrate-binding protein